MTTDKLVSIICLLIALGILTCGGEYNNKYRRYTDIEDMPEDIRKIVDRRCATSGCHINGAIVDIDSSGSAFKESGSLRSIQAARMPKAGSSEAQGFEGSGDEVDLLKYLGE